jgi:hypothetical protein
MDCRVKPGNDDSSEVRAIGAFQAPSTRSPASFFLPLFPRRLAQRMKSVCAGSVEGQTGLFHLSSCPGLTRASIPWRQLQRDGMDCRIKSGNDDIP